MVIGPAILNALGATVAKLKGEPLPEKAADPRALDPVPTTSDNICHMKS
jgi:hypothetical protein